MKTLQHCIRCHSLRDGAKRFNSFEITSVYLCINLELIDLEIKKVVCFNCRQSIGDEIANKMLKGG